MKRIIITLLLLSVLLTACAKGEAKTAQSTSQSPEKQSEALTKEETEEVTDKEAESKMKITVNGKEFYIIKENNETAQALSQALPLSLEMNELHGNEKYYYLDFTLPENAENVKKVNKGDVMLFGDSCLVIFYKSFNTSYSYTRIGKIENADGLEEALGGGNVKIEFFINRRAPCLISRPDQPFRRLRSSLL